MNRRTITIAVVAVLALGLGFVVYGILTAPRKPANPPRNVVVSNVAIPKNAKVIPSMLAVVQKAAEEAPADALSDPMQTAGDIATADIPANAIVTVSMVAKPPTPPPDLVSIPTGMRAITIQIDPVKGVAGLLRPGDRVDVIAARTGGGGPPVAATIVRDSKVLAVGSETQRVAPVLPSPGAIAGPPQPPATTVTLALTPQQVDLVTSADLSGYLRLALRPPHEPSRSAPVETFAVPETASANAAPPQPPQVEVVNGDTIISRGSGSGAGAPPTSAMQNLPQILPQLPSLPGAAPKPSPT